MTPDFRPKEGFHEGFSDGFDGALKALEPIVAGQHGTIAGLKFRVHELEQQLYEEQAKHTYPAVDEDAGQLSGYATFVCCATDVYPFDALYLGLYEGDWVAAVLVHQPTAPPRWGVNKLSAEQVGHLLESNTTRYRPNLMYATYIGWMCSEQLGMGQHHLDNIFGD